MVTSPSCWENSNVPFATTAARQVRGSTVTAWNTGVCVMKIGLSPAMRIVSELGPVSVKVPTPLATTPWATAMRPPLLLVR